MEDPIEVKLEKIVKTIYRGAGIAFGKNAKTALKKIKEMGGDKMPVCIAKTQFSFTDNAAKTGVESGFTITFENLVLNHGAGFVVAVAGEIMRMPGLPKEPAAMQIDVVDGQITGLS